MKIYFYFDPCCPWCWVTSRWLNEVSGARGFSIQWRPFSLALKNNEVVPNDEEQSPYGKHHRSAHRLLRVIEAAVEQHGEMARFKMYSSAGALLHVKQLDELFTDKIIRGALNQNNFDENLALRANDIAYDRDLQKHLDEALAVVGQDVGVPTIVFEDDNAVKTGYFGPVITKLPSLEDGLKLWDGIVLLAKIDGFFELKRSRTEPIDTLSTKRTLGL